MSDWLDPAYLGLWEWWDMWLRWWTGAQLGSEDLWGLPMVVWGRIGKGLQFLAGLTVVLDLIGPRPLREFGRRLQVVPWQKGVDKPAEVAAQVLVVLSLLGYVGILLTAVLSKYFDPIKRWIDNFDLSDSWVDTWWGAVLVLLVLLLLSLIGVVVADASLGDESKSSAEGGVSEYLQRRARDDEVAIRGCLFVVAVVPAGILLIAILLPWLVFIYGICLPISKGLTALLNREKPAHLLRWIAFGIFVVGFQFDLLAS